MKKRLLLPILILTLSVFCGCEKETSDVATDTPKTFVADDFADVSSDSNTTKTEESVPEVEKTEEASSDSIASFVNDLEVAKETSQIMIVSATGDSAVLTLYNKNEEGCFEEVLSADASIGEKGIGKAKEGDRKTPKGRYAFTMAFGLKENPGSQIPYTKLNASHYWVDDSSSKYYNQFVSTQKVTKDWSSAEDLYHSGSSYNYAMAINYNESCVPKVGSAIFLHCRPTGGAGCIAVDESVMKRLVKETTPECILIIDTPEAIDTY